MCSGSDAFLLPKYPAGAKPLPQSLRWRRDGLGAAQDPAQAIGFFRKACEGGEADGCYNLGVMVEDGDGVAKDAAQSVTLFRQACDAGEMRGCKLCYIERTPPFF